MSHKHPRKAERASVSLQFPNQFLLSPTYLAPYSEMCCPHYLSMSIYVHIHTELVCNGYSNFGNLICRKV